MLSSLLFPSKLPKYSRFIWATSPPDAVSAENRSKRYRYGQHCPQLQICDATRRGKFQRLKKETLCRATYRFFNYEFVFFTISEIVSSSVVGKLSICIFLFFNVFNFEFKKRMSNLRMLSCFHMTRFYLFFILIKKHGLKKRMVRFKCDNRMNLSYDINIEIRDLYEDPIAMVNTPTQSLWYDSFISN